MSRLNAEAKGLELLRATEKHQPRKESRNLSRTAEVIVCWYRANARDLPWRRQPYCLDPYAVYISEVMLQQTQVKTVIPYWQRWMARFPNIASVAEANESAVLKAWEGLGYYTRARNIQNAAREVLDQHGGVFPTRYEDVLALPGIGRYTAGAICSIAFGMPTAILDGNVVRVLARQYGVHGNVKQRLVVDQLWRLSSQGVLAAAALTGSGELPCSAFNQGLMELGATICTPKNARCDLCPVSETCQALAEGLIDRLPEMPARAKSRKKTVLAFVLKHRNRVLVRQRDENAVNGNLWEFPTVEVKHRRQIGAEAAKLIGIAVPRKAYCMSIQHAIMQHRITTRVYQPELSLTPAELRKRVGGVWLPLPRLNELAFSGAHARIRDHLLAASPESGVRPR